MKTLATATLFALLIIGAGCGEQEDAEGTRRRPWVALHTAALQGNVDAIRQHIEAGSDLDQKDAYGSTPLAVAATFGKTEVARALIGGGADLSITNNEGATPLHIAAFLCHEEIVGALLEAGADKGVRTRRVQRHWRPWPDRSSRSRASTTVSARAWRRWGCGWTTSGSRRPGRGLRRCYGRDMVGSAHPTELRTVLRAGCTLRHDLAQHPGQPDAAGQAEQGQHHGQDHQHSAPCDGGRALDDLDVFDQSDAGGRHLLRADDFATQGPDVPG